MNREEFAQAAPGTLAERRRARMRKKLRLLGIACLAVAVLAAGVILLNRNAETDAAADAAPAIALDLMPASGKAERFSYIDTAGETVTLQRDGEDWRWVQQPDFPVDAAAVQELLAVLTDVIPQESFTPRADADYGFDTPTQVITLADGSAGRTVTVGAKNAVSGNYYLRVEGETQLYTVAELFVSYFETDMLEMMVHEAIPKLEKAVFHSVTVETPGASPLVLTMEGGSPVDGEAVWLASQDGETARVADETAATLYSRLSTINYAEAVAWKPQPAALAEFGLDEENRTVLTIDYTVTDEKGVSVTDTLTLYVGNVGGTMSRYHVTAPQQNGVYRMPGALVETLLSATPATLAEPPAEM